MAVGKRSTRTVSAGSVRIGGAHPVSVQSMCATPTSDVHATLEQVRQLQTHGADIIRIAVDSQRDLEALKQIRKETDACLTVDLQENYKLAAAVSSIVQKIRYNPGHLHHVSPGDAIKDKVKFIVDAAGSYGCAVRIGVNFGSLGAKGGRTDSNEKTAINIVSAHIDIMEGLGFRNYLVSLKSSDPLEVVRVNEKFAAEFSEVPLHLGVTEAGMLPEGEEKTRMAFEPLLSKGIGETVRVSLTLPAAEKYKEIQVGRKILEDVKRGVPSRSIGEPSAKKLNIVSCPSCSRVENLAFVELAQKVKELSAFAAGEPLTIAVMGCRVNGPGETDTADLGLWCAAGHVNLKCHGELIGAFSYEEVLPKVKLELERLIKIRKEASNT